jgi:hypothetical protein
VDRALVAHRAAGKILAGRLLAGDLVATAVTRPILATPNHTKMSR